MGKSHFYINRTIIDSQLDLLNLDPTAVDNRLREIGFRLISPKSPVFQLSHQPETGPQLPVAYEIELSPHNLADAHPLARVLERTQGVAELDQGNLIEIKPSPANGNFYLRQAQDISNGLAEGAARSLDNGLHFHVGAGLDPAKPEHALKAAKIALAWSIIEPAYIETLPAHRRTYPMAKPVGQALQDALLPQLTAPNFPKVLARAVAPRDFADFEASHPTLESSKQIKGFSDKIKRERYSPDREHLMNLVSLYRIGTVEFRGEALATDRQLRVGPETTRQLQLVGTFFSDLVEKAPSFDIGHLQELIQNQRDNPAQTTRIGMEFLSSLTSSEEIDRFFADRLLRVAESEKRALDPALLTFARGFQSDPPKQFQTPDLPEPQDGDWERTSQTFAKENGIEPEFLDDLRSAGLVYSAGSQLVFLHQKAVNQRMTTTGASVAGIGERRGAYRLIPGTDLQDGAFWFQTSPEQSNQNTGHVVLTPTVGEALRLLQNMEDEGEQPRKTAFFSLNGNGYLPVSDIKSVITPKSVVLVAFDDTTPPGLRREFTDLVRSSFVDYTVRTKLIEAPIGWRNPKEIDFEAEPSPASPAPARPGQEKPGPLSTDFEDHYSFDL